MPEMPALDEILEAELITLRERHRYREVQLIERLEGAYAQKQGKKLLSFASNDYFGLSQHPKVIKAAVKATECYGTGSGASRLITGNHPLYEDLENALAIAKHTEAACVFGSGYLANIGVITALMGKGDLILLDKLAHACLLDGAKLSGARWLRFKHNDVADCKRLLKKYRGDYHRCFIITETVFSMDGDVAPLRDLASLASETDAWLMSDDAHGLGFVMESDAAIQTGTLSKGIGGYGGYVCGSNTLVNYLFNKARSFVFSTALPPSVLAAAMESLRIIMENKNHINKALNYARLFAELLHLPVPNSPIVPLIVGEDKLALQASKDLEKNGFLVSAIRPPTVPQGTARLRFTFSSIHKKEDIQALAKIIQQQDWYSKVRILAA